MIIGPMTFLIAIALAVCFIVGAIILARSVGGATNEPMRCPRCRNANPRRARYCASCGQDLSTCP